MPKIICIGWHKTGTTTIGDALLTLGYSVTGCREDLAYPLLDGNIKPAIEIATTFDAVQDVPWAALFEELDLAFPNSKFIITKREELSWLNSAKKHFKDSDIKLHEWIYGTGILEGNEAIYLERYRKHYKDIETYFKNRPNDFIIMDLKQGDGWVKLCKFLNKPIPKKKFPHSNKAPDNFTLKDKIINKLRHLAPNWLRLFRIKILILLGYPDRRDRFKNKKFNQIEQSKRKKN